MNKFFSEEIRRTNEVIAISRDDSKVLIAASVNVEPLKTSKVEITACHSFAPERVIIPCICEKDFKIIEMSINGVIQAFVKNEMPASAFSEEKFRSRIKMDPCPCSANITVVVRNICPVKSAFIIAIAGPKIKDPQTENGVVPEKVN